MQEDPDARLVFRALKTKPALSHTSVRLAYLAATAVGVLMLFPAASAQAADVIVGSPLTATFAPVQMCKPVCTGTDITLPETGAYTTSPVSGRIVRWHLLDASGGELRVRVLHPVGGEKYEGQTPSSFETPTSTGLQTFTVSLPIEAGDLISLENSSAAVEIGDSSVTGAEIGAIQPALSEPGSGYSLYGSLARSPSMRKFNRHLGSP